MTERSWSEFQSTVHPADDATCGKVFRGLLDENGFLAVMKLLSIFSCEARKFAAVDGWSPKWMIGNFTIGIPKMDTVYIQRRSQCTAGIPRSWGNEDALKP